MPAHLADTNVLLRAADESSAHHDAAREAISALVADGNQIVLAGQALAEFWSVATRPVAVNGLGWTIERAENEVRRLLDQFPLLPDKPELFAEWLSLVVSHRVVGKKAHDMRLVALMNTCRVTHLITFNTRDFSGYGITVASPRDILGKSG